MSCPVLLVAVTNARAATLWACIHTAGRVRAGPTIAVSVCCWLAPCQPRGFLLPCSAVCGGLLPWPNLQYNTPQIQARTSFDHVHHKGSGAHDAGGRPMDYDAVQSLTLGKISLPADGAAQAGQDCRWQSRLPHQLEEAVPPSVLASGRQLCSPSLLLTQPYCTSLLVLN